MWSKWTVFCFSSQIPAMCLDPLNVLPWPFPTFGIDDLSSIWDFSFKEMRHEDHIVNEVYALWRKRSIHRFSSANSKQWTQSSQLSVLCNSDYLQFYDEFRLQNILKTGGDAHQWKSLVFLWLAWEVGPVKGTCESIHETTKSCLIGDWGCRILAAPLQKVDLQSG